MKAAQRAVAFVAFGNEIFAALVPIGVRTEDWNFSAHVMRRMQSAFAKHMCRHCGRGCFAMHSGDHNAALGSHDCSDGFSAAEQRFSTAARGQKDWIVVLDCRGKNNKLRNVRMLCEMLFMEVK